MLNALRFPNKPLLIISCVMAVWGQIHLAILFSVLAIIGGWSSYEEYQEQKRKAEIVERQRFGRRG